MSTILKKALAKISDPMGQILVTAAICAVCVLAVLHTTSMAVRGAYGDEPKGVILTFAANDASDLAGKLGSDELDVFPVTLSINGASKVILAEGGTVADLLADNDVMLTDLDVVSLELDKKLEEFDKVSVLRCEKEDYTVEDPIPYETYYFYSPEVAAGREVVAQQGAEGFYAATYSRYTYQGEVVKEVLVDEETVEPVDEEIHMGFKSHPVSKLDFEWNFDEEGEPAEYTDVLRESRAAGYSAPNTASTASGLPAVVGHVAVNPNVIPYGSKLFIQSTDGEFIYGYAVAADTGTALMQGVIDVDLFYGTYEQSAANGIKEVDIFILE